MSKCIFWKLSVLCVVVCCMWALPRGEGLPTPPGSNLKRDGPVSRRSCAEGLYQPQSSSLCCQECPAGEHPVSPWCSSEGGRSACSECLMGTYTAHGNSLRSCLTCTRCRPDEEEVQPCSPTTDTVCRCKAGSFCAHDQACEVCHRCRSCKDGETLVKPCTSDSNSECAKTPTPGTPTEALGWILGVLFAVGGVVVVVVGVWVYKKRRPWLKCQPSLSPGHSQQDAVSLEITQNAHNVSVQTPLLRSEDPRIDDSSGLGSSSSETSLNDQHPNPCTSMPPPRTCTEVPRRARTRTPSPSSARNDDDKLLDPLNGDKSLKDCFEFFHVHVDCKIHKRFFRSLDLDDNDINNANNEDRVYELLGVWLQKQGKGATLHHLLAKLRDLDQNQTADSIVKKAIANGHYERRVTPHPPHSVKSDE